MNSKILIYYFPILIFVFSCEDHVTKPKLLILEQSGTPKFKSLSINTNYYISNNGNDINDGTLLAPFQTIQKGLEVTIPGDTIFVKAGTYEEYVRFYASGTAERPIVLKNYNNDIVTIDAQSIRVFCLYTNNQSYITVEGINMQNATTYNIAVSGGNNILLKNIKSTLPLGLIVPHIEFASSPKNITLQNITAYGGSYGVYIGSDVDSINIIGGEFCYAAIDGISVYGGGMTTKNITVDGAYSHHNNRQGIDMAQCQNITIRNCHCSYNAASGIQIEAQGNNSLIEDNLCEYNCRGGGYANSDYETGIWIFNADVSKIRRNIIRGNQTGMRFLLASNFQAYNNVICNNNYHPSTFPTTQNTSGVDFRASSGVFYNNTLYGNSACDSKLGSVYVYPDSINNLVIKNNIVMNDGSARDMCFDQSTGFSVISDHNLVYNVSREVRIQWGSKDQTWEEYKTVSGQDTHSINDNPLFVDQTIGDYNLQAKSPARNTGENMKFTDGNLDSLIVRIPHIGAYEFRDTIPRLIGKQP